MTVEIIMEAVEKFLKQFLVQVIGIFRPEKKIAPRDVPVNLFKRILIVRQHDQLGDLLITTPAIRAVRKRFPNAYIGVVVREYTAPMMWENPNVNEIIVFYENFKKWNWPTLKGFWSQLRRDGGYDCAIVLNTVSRSLSSDIIAVLSKAKYIVGPSHIKAAPDTGEKIYNVITPRSYKIQTEIEHNLDIIRALGVQPDGFEYDLELENEERGQAESIIHSLGIHSSQVTIGVHFGTLDNTRRFPFAKLAKVIDWLKDHYECEIILIVGPNEVDARTQLISLLKNKVVSAPVMPIRVAAAFIKQMRLFLCNDTGTLHIASAMRVPTVSFHSLNDPAVWKPPHARHIAVRAADKKITSITVEQVIEALKVQLKDYTPRET
ncbi:MAG: glycosyltransferase family 9 protein [Bacteroidota bacterium]|nr:glycosyltransferase family 9 protein [Bacteroidota bacterium]